MKTFYTLLKQYILTALLVLTAAESRGQAPVIAWDKVLLSGPYNIGTIRVQSFEKTNDGGYILLCNNLQIVKTDGNGYAQWQKVYTSDEKRRYWIHTVQPTNDGGYIVAGLFKIVDDNSVDVLGNGLIIKLNSKGEQQWEKVIPYERKQTNEYGARVYQGYSICSVFQTADGGYIAGLMPNGSIYNYGYAGIHKEAPDLVGVRVLKLDASGNTQWLKIYDEPESEIQFIRPTKDGGYIVLFKSVVEPDPIELYKRYGVQNVLKLDNAGNSVWKKSILSLNSYMDFYTSPNNTIYETFEGEYIIGGYAYMGVDNQNNWERQGVSLVKLSSAGDVQWEQTMRERKEYFGGLNITTDGGFIFSYSELDAPQNKYFKKLDKDGNTQWQLDHFDNISPQIILQTSEKEYIAVGSKSIENTTQQLRFVMLVSCSLTATASNTGPYMEGSSIQLSTPGTGTYAWTGPQGFTSTAQNPVIPNATVAHSGTYRVTVTDANTCTAEATTEVVVNVPLSSEPQIANWLQAFPNPARGNIQVKVPYDGTSRALLYSAEGKLMQQADFTKSTSLNTQNLRPGIYPLRVVNGNKETTVKVVVE